MVRTSVQTGARLFDELRGSWRELAAASPGATPFQTWEWQSTWWRHYGGLRSPHVVAFHEGDDLVGLMPLMRSVGPWRTLRPMGVGPSDYLQPLARAGYESKVADLLAAHLRECKGVDLLDLQQVRESQPLADGLRSATVIEQATCLLLDLPETYDQYLAMLGKSLRYDVRKLDKSLFKEGRATFQHYGPEDVQEGFDVFLDQHRARWKKRGLPGAFLGKSVRFHRDWIRQAAHEGWLWLSTLRVDGKPIGSIYAMTLADTTYYYQAGFDPEQGAVSPGTLLVANTIRRSIDEGKRHFDFMRGDEPYKRRWKPQHVLRNLRFLIPGDGALGRLGSSWNQTGSRVEARVRARLEGRGLL
jgi:CelD/BcsL family acetyltransferase involved in cellulose biosynthesis